MKNKFARLHFLYTLLILSTAFFLCGILLLYVHWCLWNIDDEFKADAGAARSYIRDQLTQNETVLIGLGAFLKGRESLDLAALDAYSTVMMQRFSHIAMFQIAQHINAQSAPSYQHIMRQQGITYPVVSQFGGAQIKVDTAASHGTLPVIFVSPESSKSVLGLDLASIDFIRQALPSATHSDITISAPIELLEGDKALVMMQSIPASNTHKEAYVSLLLVKQSMLFLKQNIDKKWNVSITAKPPKGKEFLMGELVSQVNVRPNSYFFHKLVVADDIQFARYKINVQLSKNVSWRDIDLWQLAFLVMVMLIILVLMGGVYRRHLSFEMRRDRHQKVLFKQANYDALTRLPNRFYFEDAARRILVNAGRQKEGVLLLFVDLNGFKKINDSLGHDAGDKVLKEVARALTSVLRQSDLAARLGGDEFAILINGISNLTAVLHMIEKVRLVLGSLQVEGVPTDKVSGSVGFAYTLQHGYDLKKLLKVADNSMYGEKSFHYAAYQDVN
jgi:diguanylate cyclase (GGDEF)-like protein